MIQLIKKYKSVAIIILIVVVGFAVWLLMFRKANDVIVLETEKVEYGTVSISVTATGTLQPVDTVAIGSQISGIIQNVYVDFNAQVKKGQLLARLDKSIMEAQVQQFAATLQQAKANVLYQESNYERQSKLYTVGAISKAELETAVYQNNSAKDNVNSITAQLKTVQKNLTFTDIYSPIDGTVLSRKVSEGQTVAASLSTPTLFVVAKDLTKMQVQASVDEADIGNIKIGQRAMFSVDAFPADTFAGVVKEIRLRAYISSNVVTYITIIDAPNNDMKLKPGMTANITIYTREIKNTLLIPASGLAFVPDSLLLENYHISNIDNAAKKTKQSKSQQLTDSSGIKISQGFVWLRYDNTTIINRAITTGLDDKTVVQVISGLKEGDEVITGYKKVKKKDAASTKSPFMPTRGGRPPR